MSKTGNTLTMLKLLESGKKYSVKELSDILEVNPRMIYVYKGELEKCGIYIDTIRGRYGGYVYHQQHDYNISFDYLDVDAIESVLYKLNENEKRKISTTLEKIRSIVIYSTDEERNIEVDEEDIKEKILVISKAINEKQRLKFIYNNKPRIFLPSNFTYYKDYVYVTGYSIIEEDIKTLNLSKIEKLEVEK